MNDVLCLERSIRWPVMLTGSVVDGERGDW